jgi:hypothetical protein
MLLVTATKTAWLSGKDVRTRLALCFSVGGGWC